MKKSVTKWAPLVAAELSIQGVPLPQDLILELIRVESGGAAGAVNPSSGASGLMQVMPITLQDYNQRHGTAYTLPEMRGKTAQDAQKQIRVGIATLAHYWQRAYQYLKKRWEQVPVDELAHIADLYYTAGPGATQKKLDKLPDPSWSAVQAAYPGWNALPHPKKVLAEPKPWDLEAIGTWLEAGTKGLTGKLKEFIEDPSGKGGLVAGILILMAAYYWMKKGNK